MPVVEKLKDVNDSVHKVQARLAGILLDCLNADPSGLTQEEMSLARSGQKIPVIKSIRNRLGIGLMEAKEMTEKWQRDNGIDPFGGQR